jgi:cell division protein FtsL
MTRLNLILFFVLMLTAIALVEAQHRARKLYDQLDQAQKAEKKYELEYNQLQLEQSTWAMHSRIEGIATRELDLQVPDEAHVQVVILGRVAQQALAKPLAAEGLQP